MCGCAWQAGTVPEKSRVGQCASSGNQPLHGAIGFEPWHVRFFVIAEATALGLLSGGVGVAIAYPFVNNLLGRAIEENMGGMFPYFRVQPSSMLLATVIAIVLSTLASLIPSIQAGRVSVTDALRRVG